MVCQVAGAPCLWVEQRSTLSRAAWHSTAGGTGQHRLLHAGGVRCQAVPLAVAAEPSSGDGGMSRVIDTELRTEAEQSYLAVLPFPHPSIALQSSTLELIRRKHDMFMGVFSFAIGLKRAVPES